MSYIDKETAIFAAVKALKGAPHTTSVAVVGALEEIPDADVVAVVRCGECKRWKADGGYGHDLDGTKRQYGVCAITNMAYKENHFCCFGAKRSEE